MLSVISRLILFSVITFDLSAQKALKIKVSTYEAILSEMLERGKKHDQLLLSVIDSLIFDELLQWNMKFLKMLMASPLMISP